MSKILVNGIWYEQISVSSMYEREFEAIILQRSDLLFPQYYLVPFKKTVYSDEDSARADLALIERNYREWWVVEVELSQHSFEGHIIPQVETLTRAKYGYDEAKYLSQQSTKLNYERLEDMMKGIQPKVLIIVNQPKTEWVLPLKRYQTLMTVVELFRSDRNEYICRVNGESPTPNLSVITECQVHAQLRTFLSIASPASLNVAAGATIGISFQGTLTEWKRTDLKNAVYLVFKGKENPLRRSIVYMLLRNSDGQFEFRVK
jgi:hypothetical protein